MLQKKKTHALFCLYYIVICEFKYENKMVNLSRLVLTGHDTGSEMVQRGNWP